MPSLLIELHISSDEMLRYYRGEAQVVYAVATDGQSVQFPAPVLQRHLTKDGVHGCFRLIFTADHKFMRLEPADTTTGLDQTG
jgi:hypothetical protein